MRAMRITTEAPKRYPRETFKFLLASLGWRVMNVAALPWGPKRKRYAQGALIDARRLVRALESVAGPDAP